MNKETIVQIAVAVFFLLILIVNRGSIDNNYEEIGSLYTELDELRENVDWKIKILAELHERQSLDIDSVHNKTIQVNNRVDDLIRQVVRK